MSHTVFVQPAVASLRQEPTKLARGPRRSNSVRALITLLVESFLEARAMTHETNRRFPFGSE
jgi:L-ribulose-5-phosphate 3-epimerase UlaE